MKRKVILSKTAEKQLDKLFDYLVNKWSLKVKNDFIEKLDSAVQIMIEQPEIFPVSKKRKGLRKCVITKQTILFYRYNSKQILIVAIFDSRQHPDKLFK